jgi:hypothetical protein
MHRLAAGFPRPVLRRSKRHYAFKMSPFEPKTVAAFAYLARTSES